MYNGQRVKDLLRERGFSSVQLLEHMGLKENGTIARFTNTDIKASRLEQIADFFGVSIDYFFDRNEGVVNIAPHGAAASNGGNATYNAYGSAKSRELSMEVAHLKKELEAKERIISEKDERIKLLEKLLLAYERKQ